MIKYAYSQRNQYNATPIRNILCWIVFLDISAFFFLTFMNICFDTLVNDPPQYIMVILYLIMFLDLIAELYYQRKITISFVVNSLILILLILSWNIDQVQILYCSAIVLIRFPQVVQFNDTMQRQIRHKIVTFKIYTLFKITYLFLFFGHIFGCIFYAIDNRLIKQQYFGSISQNPYLYYQGRLLCYTPIYSLNEIDRYIYAIYFLFALIATVAYGDIIPKNPFQNAYVCFLLVFSTVSIGYVIQQLFIILRKNRAFTLQILKKMKYFDIMLEKNSNITKNSKFKLLHFLFYSLQNNQDNTPDLRRLSKRLQLQLMEQSVGIMRNAQSGNNLVQLNSQMPSIGLPQFLAQFLLTKLKFKHYPGDYPLLQNEDLDEPPNLFITINGEINLGYGNKLLMKTTIRQKSKLVGWREFIWNNKEIHPYLRFQTERLCELYLLPQESLQNLIQTQKDLYFNTENSSNFLEKYHFQRMKQLNLISKEKNDYEEEQSLTMDSQNSFNISIQNDPNHNMYCWICGKKTHFPINCQKMHYKPRAEQLLKSQKRQEGRKINFKRKKRQNRKILRVKMNEQQISQDKYLQSYLGRKMEELQSLKNAFYRVKPSIFQHYYHYEHFFHQANL